MTCEFCQAQTRKDAIGEHVRSKHAHEVGRLLLTEYMTGSKITPILQYASGKSVRNITIHSAKHEGVYWFGVKARYFDDEDSWSSYTADEANMTSHEEFLLKCFETISLKDFFTVGRELAIQHPDVIALRQQSHIAQREREDALHEVEDLRQKCEYMRQSIQDLQEEMKESGTTPRAVQEENRHYKSLSASLAREKKELQMALKTIEDRHEKYIQEMSEAHRSSRRQDEEQMMILMDQVQKLKTRNVKEQDRDAKKDHDKKKKAKLAMEEKLKAMKAEQKALKRQLAAASDSDSDSDDD
jgi:myosin heavy subunit